MRFSIATWRYRKKSVRFFFLFFVLMAVFAPLFSGCIGTGRGQVEQMGKLQSLHCEWGSFWGGYYDFTLTQNPDGTVRLIAKERSRSRFDVDKTLDGKVLQQLQALLLEKEIYRWNGFDKKDQSVLDGGGFHLVAQYEKGKLEAKGYMKYPKNYNLGSEALYNYLLALVPEAQQSPPPG